MTAQPEPREVESVVDLVQLVELSEFRTYRLVGQRAATTDERQPSQSLSVLAGGDSTHIECRVRMLLATEHADLEADIGAVYTIAEPVALTSAVVAEFIERVGVMAVFPFLREAVFTTASRLGVPAPVVGILRAGEARVEFDEDATWPPRSEVSAP